MPASAMSQASPCRQRATASPDEGDDIAQALRTGVASSLYDGSVKPQDFVHLHPTSLLAELRGARSHPEP